MNTVDTGYNNIVGSREIYSYNRYSLHNNCLCLFVVVVVVVYLPIHL